jgi:hypothetical protein
MTDLALVAGIPPEIRVGKKSSLSSFGEAFAFTWRTRGGRAGVAFGDEDSLGGDSGTPVGRTASCAWAESVSANANTQKQANQLRLNFIGGQITSKKSQRASK